MRAVALCITGSMKSSYYTFSGMRDLNRKGLQKPFPFRPADNSPSGRHLTLKPLLCCYFLSTNRELIPHYSHIAPAPRFAVKLERIGSGVSFGKTCFLVAPACSSVCGEHIVPQALPFLCRTPCRAAMGQRLRI